MATAEAVSRVAVLAAMDEFDGLGREAFLEKYGFGPAKEYVAIRDGSQYDSKALYGVAYGIENPDEGPLRTNQFSGGEGTVVRRLQDLGFEVRRLSAGTGSWIFQANPKYYDIRGSLANLREMNWTTAQYVDEIRPGDAVFVWESGPQGGIMGRGTVLTRPQEMPDQEGQEFIRDQAKFAGAQTRVRLSIDEVLPRPLGRSVLVDHPVLRDLQILKFANATNFKVTPEQRAALDALFAEQRPQESTGRIRSGFEQVLATYAEARATAPLRGDHDAVVSMRQLNDDLASEAPVATRPGVDVRWSAGRGNWATVPWIACLDKRETASIEEGIYVVYLFRGDMSGVYLAIAQGVTRLRGDHGVPGARDVLRTRARSFIECLGTDLEAAGFSTDEGIELRGGGLGTQYETSTIAYRFYEAEAVPDDAELLRDLDAALDIYGRHVASEVKAPPPIAPRADLKAICDEFSGRLSASNLSFGAGQDRFVRSFIASLATKPFVILTGLSGSGKTQLAIKLGEWFGEGRFHIEAVRPDWTGAEALFGYEDALQPAPSGRGAWSVPKPLEFILRAAGDPYWPYLLVLDEMNLAHVERYFADILSGMESRHASIPNLVRGDDDGRWRVAAVPAANRLPVPRNLFVAGTVNVDETTYMFSPKVLDRANTFEFRVQTGDLSPSVERPRSVQAGTPELVRGFLEIAEDDRWQLEYPAAGLDVVVQQLSQLHALLSEAGFEFGHRVFYEALRFSAMLAAAGNEDPYEALDLQVMQKILPRLHGSRRRLEGSLAALGKFCFDLGYEAGEVSAATPFDPGAQASADPRLPLSFDKVRRMMRTLRANQFVSFTD